MTRRVVVTGIGVVTPFGCDPDGAWAALKAGRSATGLVDGLEDAPERCLGAPVAGFVPRAHIDAKSLRLMAPAVAFGTAAAALAITDAGVRLDAFDPVRTGAFVGSRGHSSDRADLQPAVRKSCDNGVFRLDRFGSEGLPLVNPLWLLKGLANNVLYFVSLRHNLQGMNNNISMGGVAATMAIGEAWEAIRHGQVDVAIAGGYDSALDADRTEMFGASGLVAQSDDPATASRPFDRRRTGFVPGEGAGFLVLENLDAAERRGARMLGEVIGYGNAASATSAPDGPSSAGFAAALTSALKQAGGKPPDAVFAHGLATRSADLEETKGLAQVLGSQASRVPVPALKSMLGNSFAASGGVEAVMALLALRDQVVPPTINLMDPDPGCNLDYVAGTEARAMPLDRVALNNANLSGAHAALIFGRVS